MGILPDSVATVGLRSPLNSGPPRLLAGPNPSSAFLHFMENCGGVKVYIHSTAVIVVPLLVALPFWREINNSRCQRVRTLIMI